MDSCGGVGGGGVNNSVAFFFWVHMHQLNSSRLPQGSYSLARLALSISCSKSSPRSIGSNCSIRSTISTS